MSIGLFRWGNSRRRRGFASRVASAACLLSVLIAASASPVAAQLISYASSAVDLVGSTGAAAVALGVPDYRFVNDAGLGFGGTSSDVFDPGETVEFSFPTPLRNHPGQHDLVLSAFIGGLGATDNATVQVEVSSDGSNFTSLPVFDTQDGRNIAFPSLLYFENDFEAVKHFNLEFGAADLVTHVRVTNLVGTSEGLRLDALEGLHPKVDSPHAFEVRFERVRHDVSARFRPRIKNTADPDGVPIREWIMDRPETFVRLEDTVYTMASADGSFVCVENCILDNHPTTIPFSRHVWSIDGATEAPPGVGLEPGRQATLARYESFDTDGDGVLYLSGFEFTVVFADGLVHTFSYDDDMLKDIGSLYQKYQYFSATPIESWNRPVGYYEFAAAAPAAGVPALSRPVLSVLVLLSLGTGMLLVRRTRQNPSGDSR